MQNIKSKSRKKIKKKSDTNAEIMVPHLSSYNYYCSTTCIFLFFAPLVKLLIELLLNFLKREKEREKKKNREMSFFSNMFGQKEKTPAGRFVVVVVVL